MTPTTGGPTAAARFAATYALLRAAADVGDHWIQTHTQALTKGQHDHTEGQSSAAGRRACAAHVATYTATQAVALIGGSALLGMRLRPGRVAAALALSAATHYVADRRRPVQRLAEAVGKGDFYRLADHGMNGAYQLDQALHHGVEAVAALIAATGTTR
ncbi:hypothetical protein GCM10010441_45280 [Kitasatospora paracochleata]|uniref:LexA-binding, inner membrane-associated hydrolase n=1 Tax=Kitasatospora paracochleata TaxID=58354 RepID=A0ABT1J9I1_9ACTN|nr:hypothetical protein [Kitasatospora paracochleata]MCP2314106.1 hypothetical protein [Kitasatospora paracochleata]